MGYLVGRVCHAEKSDALNEVMTQVTPTIDKDGVLRHPVFNGQSWEYQGQVVDLNLPECNEHAHLDLGQSIGLNMVYAFIAIASVIIIKKTIWEFRERGEE